MRRRLPNEYAEEDEGHNPRVFLKGVDESESEDGDDVGDDGNDDATDADGHGVIGDGAENLAAHDDVHDRETPTY